MKSTTATVIALVTLAGGAAGGYFYGQRKGAEAGATAERLRLAEDAPKTPAALATAAPALTAEQAAALVPPPKGFENLSLEEILASAGPMDRFQAIMAYVQRLPKAELEPALKRLTQQMRGRFDPEMLFAGHMLMTRFGAEDSKGAMSYLKTLDMFGQGFGTATVLATMATKDPLAAAEFFKDESNPLLNVPQSAGFMAGAVAKEWAKKDPAAALEWAQGLRDGLRGGALGSIIGSMAIEDPAKAAEKVASLKLDAGDDRKGVYGQVAQSWAARDPQAALEWAGSLPAGAEKEEATRRSLDSWANSDPTAAAAHLDSLSDAAEKQKLMGAVTGPWARRDPAGTAEWLTQQPEGKGREEGTRNVMWMWTATDPTAASTWLNEQPSGSSKDEGIVTLANQTFANDPEAAMAWNATISDPLKRGIQLKSGVQNWMKKDEAAARQWVESTPSLSAEERVNFLQGK